MRSWLSLVALLTIVLALGAWVYYRPAPGVAETYALSTLKPAAVKRVRFERPHVAQRPSAAVIALERHGDDWRMAAPLPARAESSQVERLFSILSARSTVRYPAGDLARYGLEQPHASLTLDDQTFTYGAINKTTREQYILTGNQVYLVPLAYSTGLPRDTDALLALQVLAGNETPVRFELPDFDVSLHDGRWTVTPVSPEASADERNAWVDAWRHARAVRAARSDKRAAAQSMTVELKEGRPIVIGIVQREPELVLLRHDEGIEYHFFGDTGKRLLSPPGGKPAERVNK